MNKRGDSLDLIYYQIIFIILNLVFFGIFFYYVASAGSGLTAHEEIYAKKIALLIDGAKPGMTISVDMSDAKKFAEENGKNVEDMVKIVGDSMVEVSLSPSSRYLYSYFPDYKVEIARCDDICTFKVSENDE